MGCWCHPLTLVLRAQQPSRLLGSAVGRGGGTHPLKTSMATRPASRMAKRMERMVVRAIMPALCPLPVAGMLLGCRAGERAGGEGAPCAPPGQRGGPGRGTARSWAIAVRNGTTQARCTIIRCHHTPAGPAAAPCLSFPAGAQHAAPRDHPAPLPSKPCSCRMGARGRRSTPAAIPVLREMGIDQVVSATGLEPSRARNFTLGWERSLATLPQAGGLLADRGGHLPVSRLTGTARGRAGGRCRWVSTHPWRSWSRCRPAAP